MKREITSIDMVTRNIVEGLSGLNITTVKRVRTIKIHDGRQLNTVSRTVEYLVCPLYMEAHVAKTYKDAKTLVKKLGGVIR